MSEASHDILINDRLPAVHEYTDPDELEAMLVRVGALEFKPYPSGLFPASDLPKELGETTTMDKAWIRDNALIINALLMSGRVDLAVGGGRALLQALHNNTELMDNVIASNGSQDQPRLPVRFDGVTLENDTEPRVQNDSTGYALWIESVLINHGAIVPTLDDLDVLEKLPLYLRAIRYWEGFDQGHWEEDDRRHVSSIGVVVAGLRAAEKRFAKTRDLRGRKLGWLLEQQLQQPGEDAMQEILATGHTDISKDPPEPSFEIPDGVNIDSETEEGRLVIEALRSFSVQNRTCDAAMLLLVEPLDVFDHEQAAAIVANVETHLKREKGFARYPGDTYWGPDFHITSERGKRTTFAEGATEKRNERALGIYMSETEAQWTMFDALLASYYGKVYVRTGDAEARTKQLEYLNRVIEALVPTDDGRLLLTEAYYHVYDEETGQNKLVPNEHTPLLMSQGMLLLALKSFKDTQRAKQSGMIPV
jgi:GH15 family glucan-1,4-alpha-glucosidase